MNWQDIQWNLPIHRQPRIVAAAMATHGPGSAPSVDLKNVWWIHFYPYTANLKIDNWSFPIRPGYVGIVPPGVRATYAYTTQGTHAVIHFVVPATDRMTVPVAAMQDFGPDFAKWYTAFEEAVRWFPKNPERANVRLWDVLWRLVDGPIGEESRPNYSHEACFKALQIIEERLSEPLKVSDLIAAVDLSQSQLLRQFRLYTGTSVIGYIQKRRMDRASQLLIETDLPIGTIASMVGVADRRAFNKMVNQAFGLSPREYRKGRLLRP